MTCQHVTNDSSAAPDDLSAVTNDSSAAPDDLSAEVDDSSAAPGEFSAAVDVFSDWRQSSVSFPVYIMGRGRGEGESRQRFNVWHIAPLPNPLPRGA